MDIHLLSVRNQTELYDCAIFIKYSITNFLWFLTFYLADLGVCWKYRPEWCCLSKAQSANEGTLHSFPTNSLVWPDINKGGTLWMQR